MAVDPQAIEQLAKLHGTWEGCGKGNSPTIEAFEYREQMRFEFDSSCPLVFLEAAYVARFRRAQSRGVGILATVWKRFTRSTE